MWWKWTHQSTIEQSLQGLSPQVQRAEIWIQPVSAHMARDGLLRKETLFIILIFKQIVFVILKAFSFITERINEWIESESFLYRNHMGSNALYGIQRSVLCTHAYPNTQKFDSMSKKFTPSNFFSLTPLCCNYATGWMQDCKHIHIGLFCTWDWM